MKSVFTVTASDLADAVVDTRYDLLVVGIDKANEPAVLAKLRDLYGDAGFAVSGGEIYIEGNDSLFKPRYSDGDLMHVMKRLTAEDGCPWDKAQTHDSIRINAVEEAYELCEAIDNRDGENIREEIGDLLLQAVFHADIAERTGEFTRLDVVNSLVSKLVFRHTHIFGEDKAASPEEALKHWEAAKAVEKQAAGLEEQLARVPETFPALLRAQKIIKKLVKHGLVNDCRALTPEEFLAAVCGGIKSGLDPEVELGRLVRGLTRAYTGGGVNKISEFKDEK